MRPQLVHHHHRPYPRDVREQIFAIRSSGAASLASLAELARQVSLVYAAAVNEALVGSKTASTELAAVAAHGQTLFHDPPHTIQWLDPSLLAAEVGAPVISDFRRADCAAGGQGAPLVPFADYILFRHPEMTRVLLNIGGIANLTYLAANGSIDEVVAFDTGPGNCISDYLCRRFDPAGPGYDANGMYALLGFADHDLVNRVMDHAFFSRRPPKSTDGPEMVSAFMAVAEPMLPEEVGEQDLKNLLAAACRVTATSIVQSVRALGHPPDEFVVSGGGIENQALMDQLRKFAGGFPIEISDARGIPSQSKEALAFALLGAATLDSVPANVPSVTGARRPVVLGSITPRP
jgi:anhydro-N-acetylmuramic acid kinase